MEIFSKYHFKRRSLVFYLSAWILPIVLLTFSALLFYNFKVSKNLIIKNLESNAKYQTSAALNKTSDVFEKIESIGKTTSKSLLLFHDNKDEMLKYFHGIIEDNDEIFGMGLAYKPKYEKGKKILSGKYCWRNTDSICNEDLSSLEEDYSEKNWFKIPIEKQSEYWTEPYYDETIEENQEIGMTSYTLPLFENGKIIAVITIDVTINWIENLFKNLYLINKSEVLILTPKGNIVSYYKNSSEQRRLIAGNSIDKIKFELKQIKGFDFTDKEMEFQNEKCKVFFSGIDDTGWRLVVVYPENELYKDLDILNHEILIIFLGGILLLISLIFLISRKIAKPIKALAEIMHKQGDDFINIKIPNIDGSREIITLNTSIQELQKELIEYIHSIEALSISKERIESELNVAKKVQESMLPKLSDKIYKLENLQIAGIVNPAREVGGDFFEFRKIDENHHFFAVGDVSGKGVGAALFMSITITLLRAYMQTKGNNIIEIIDKVSNYLSKNNKRQYFVTLFSGIFNTNTGEIRYINAGHNYPIIIRENNSIETLAKTHLPPLGILYKKPTKFDTVYLESNDKIFLYTDGLTEAQNSAEEFYTLEKLNKLLQNTTGTCDEIIQKVLDDNFEFVGKAEPFDDITMLILEFISKGQDKPEIFEREYSISYQSFEQMRIEFEEALFEKNIPDRLVNKVTLVLEELVTNIIKYGIYSTQEGKISLKINNYQDYLWLELRDNSSPFDYKQYIAKISADSISNTQIGGRGLLLVGKITENFEYKFENKQNIISFNIKK